MLQTNLDAIWLIGALLTILAQRYGLPLLERYSSYLWAGLRSRIAKRKAKKEADYEDMVALFHKDITTAAIHYQVSGGNRAYAMMALSLVALCISLLVEPHANASSLSGVLSAIGMWCSLAISLTFMWRATMEYWLYVRNASALIEATTREENKRHCDKVPAGIVK